MCKTTELRILLFLIANQTNFQCLDPCHYERCFGNTRTKSTPKSTERRKLSIFVSKVIFQIVKRTKSKIYGITPFIVLPSILPSSKRGFRSVVAGGLTGGINICIVFPTEFIKTQLQLDSGKTVFTAHSSLLNAKKGFSPMATILQSSKVRAYNGSVDVIRKTVKERGIRGMYKGVTVLLSGTVPTYAVR